MQKSREKNNSTDERLLAYAVDDGASSIRWSWKHGERLKSLVLMNQWITYQAPSWCSPSEGRLFQFLAQESSCAVFLYVSVVHLSSAVPLCCYMSFTDQSAPGSCSWQPEVSRENSTSPLSLETRTLVLFYWFIFPVQRWQMKYTPKSLGGNEAIIQ